MNEVVSRARDNPVQAGTGGDALSAAALNLEEGKGGKVKLYHGRKEGIEVNAALSHGMIWLTSNPEYAAIFGEVKAYELVASNILDVSDEVYEWPLEVWQDKLERLGVDTTMIDWDALDFAPDYGYYYFYDLLPHDGNFYTDAGVIEAIRDAGYDAVLAPPESSEGVRSDITYVVFSTDAIRVIEG